MKWSLREEKFLKLFFKNTKVSLIANAISKSESSIRHKALRMGLEKVNNSNVFHSTIGLKHNNVERFLKQE